MLVLLAFVLINIPILIGLFIRLTRSLRRFRIKKHYTAALEAPSVSVCIPARNEMHAMTQCLERVLASDYRKLEVLVYDDSSHDDTSSLIRSFAHAGVRFIPGGPLPEGWLGKNHALDMLSLEASGTYVVFMDVDTEIQPTTISQLVGYMMTENLTMSSIIPARLDTWRASVLFGHLRYMWQLIASSEVLPATSSSLWAIKRRALIETVGGFTKLRQDVEPEARLAAAMGTSQYHCLVSDETLGVYYEKKWSSQFETSRRLLYPMMKASPIGTLLSLVFIAVLNAPLVAVISSVILGWGLLQWVAVVVMLGFGLLYSVYAHALWRQQWQLSIFLWPVVILQETLFAYMSVIGYKRGTITWKGRPVASRVN